MIDSGDVVVAEIGFLILYEKNVSTGLNACVRKAEILIIFSSVIVTLFGTKCTWPFMVGYNNNISGDDELYSCLISGGLFCWFHSAWNSAEKSYKMCIKTVVVKYELNFLSVS